MRLDSGSCEIHPQTVPPPIFQASGGQDVTPQLKVDIDKTAAGAMGVAVTDINSMLSAAWGGSYVNDFIDRGRVKRVYIQADAPFRMRPEDLNRWYVRNRNGDMVPFSAFGSSRWTTGTPSLERYQGSPSTGIQGMPAEGVSSGAAMQAIERIADTIESVNDYQTMIASAVEEQTATTSEMSRNVSEAADGTTQIADNLRSVATVAEQSDAGSSRTREAADQLAEVSRTLQDIVKRFRLA